MDISENQPARSSKTSRLPGPTVNGRGLAEWSDSQHNSRIQSSIPAPPTWKSLKREVSQPASQPDAKRKALADRAVEYPAKSAAATANPPRTSVKGQSLSTMSQPSQLKQPCGLNAPTPASSSSSSSFARSLGPYRNAASERQPTASKTAGRPGHARLNRSRPRTAHGHRDEDHHGDVSTSSSGTTHVPPRHNSSPPPLEVSKVRETTLMPSFATLRESSLSTRLSNLCLEDHPHNPDGSQVTPPPSLEISSQVSSSFITLTRPKNKMKRRTEAAPSLPHSAVLQGT